MMNDQMKDGLHIYARQIVIRRILLKGHITLFCLINLMLFIFNNPNFTIGQTYQWWIWVFTGWGLLLAYHFLFYIKKGSITPLLIHKFSFIVINLYMLFIDYYSDGRITWVWIPFISWLIVFIVHTQVQDDSKKHSVDMTIYGLIISDESGRVLVDVILDEETLRKKLNIQEDQLEMVGMFINAMQSFSNEINLGDALENEINLNGRDLKMHSFMEKHLTITGFVSPKSKEKYIKALLKQILKEFIDKYQKSIEIYRKTGNCNLFSDYQDVLCQQINKMDPIISW